MRIIGCDLHSRRQTLAMLETTTGEVVKTTLKYPSHLSDGAHLYRRPIPRMEPAQHDRRNWWDEIPVRSVHGRPA
jgi:hypothetical protein